MPKKKVTWCAVYVAEVGGAVKVGITNDPYARSRTLQSSMPEDLTMPYFLVLRDRASAVRIEAAAHHALADRHIRGEWFRASADEAIEAVETARGGRAPVAAMPWQQAISMAEAGTLRRFLAERGQV